MSCFGGLYRTAQYRVLQSAKMRLCRCLVQKRRHQTLGAARLFSTSVFVIFHVKETVNIVLQRPSLLRRRKGIDRRMCVNVCYARRKSARKKEECLSEGWSAASEGFTITT